MIEVLPEHHLRYRLWPPVQLAVYIFYRMCAEWRRITMILYAYDRRVGAWQLAQGYVPAGPDSIAERTSEECLK